MRILILDDEEYRHEAFNKAHAADECWHAYTLRQFMDQIERVKKFDVIYLDHDITDSKATTGLDAVRFLVRTLQACPDKMPDKVVVHSWNPIGSVIMTEELRAAGVSTYKRTFHIKDGVYDFEGGL